MAPRSKLKKLPLEVRKELEGLIAEDRLTISELAAHLRSRGINISRSAVGRYVMTWHSKHPTETLVAQPVATDALTRIIECLARIETLIREKF